MGILAERQGDEFNDPYENYEVGDGNGFGDGFCNARSGGWGDGIDGADDGDGWYGIGEDEDNCRLTDFRA